MPAEPLLEEQTQGLMDNHVPMVLLVHKVVHLGLVAPMVQVAVGGVGNPFEPVLRKDLRKVLEQVLCPFHLQANLPTPRV